MTDAVPHTMSLIDNGMEPWTLDEAEAKRFAADMARRGVRLNSSENAGVTVGEAIENMVQVAKGKVDLTRSINDDFTQPGVP